jgi:hypothetical protein
MGATLYGKVIVSKRVNTRVIGVVDKLWKTGRTVDLSLFYLRVVRFAQYLCKSVTNLNSKS